MRLIIAKSEFEEIVPYNSAVVADEAGRIDDVVAMELAASSSDRPPQEEVLASQHCLIRRDERWWATDSPLRSSWTTHFSACKRECLEIFYSCNELTI